MSKQKCIYIYILRASAPHTQTKWLYIYIYIYILRAWGANLRPTLKQNGHLAI
jgi:hypothetical protein